MRFNKLNNAIQKQFLKEYGIAQINGTCNILTDMGLQSDSIKNS